MAKPFPTPGDEPEFAGEQPEDLATEAFRRMIFMCVPPKTYGQVRLGLATQRRFIAIVWLKCPEVFEGKTQWEMATMLGMTERGFRKECAAAQLALDSRRTKK